MARATDSSVQSWGAQLRGRSASLAFDHFGWFAVFAAVGWATWARWTLLTAGPPLDTDAFAHAIIARRMLDDWRDVRVHWVWLPMWHIVGAISARFGGGIAALRSIGVLLSALGPVLLTLILRHDDDDERASSSARVATDDVIPFAAGALLAVWPLCVRGGATGQPEPLFQCLVLSACLAWERRRPITTGTLLAIAVLLRYEAWVLVIAFGALWLPRSRRTMRGACAWAIPAATIATWCAIHAWQTHEWFQFVRVNHEFARDALVRLGLALDRGHPLLALFRYLVLVPFESTGVALLFAAPGAVWVMRRVPRAFGVASVTLLAFITYAWVRRQTLGLDRHFFVVAPLYATAIAAGLCTTVAWLAKPHGRASRWLVALTAIALVAWVAGAITAPNVRFVRSRERAAYSSERQAASALAALAVRHDDIVVFCDQPVVEILSGLPTRAFIRWNVRDVRPYNLGVEARRHDIAAAVSSPDRVAGIRNVSVPIFEDARIVAVVSAQSGP